MQHDMHLVGGPGMTLEKPPFWDLHFLGLRTCKKSPFYSVKWIFFTYFPFPSSEYLYSWGKLVGCFFWSHQKSKKSPFYTVKWRFFAFLVAPENAYPTSLPQE